MAAGTTRCGEHSDYGSLTFLFQDDLGGLEVRDKSGEWVRARPVKDSMLVNTDFGNGKFSLSIYLIFIHSIAMFGYAYLLKF